MKVEAGKRPQLATPNFDDIPGYSDLIEKESKFEQDIKEIMEFIEASDMQDVIMDRETGSKLTLDTLRNWKGKYGKIYASKVTDDPVLYIWRPLFRLEYKQMVGTQSEPGEVKWTDDFLRQDAILKKCLLYPKPDFTFLRDMRAGVADTLEEQILYQSGFVPLEVAVSRVQVLG